MLVSQSQQIALNRLNLITIVRELPADLETPVSVYLKLAGSSPSFLLESVTGGEQVARYSFIGVNPSRSYLIRGRSVEVYGLNGSLKQSESLRGDPLDFLRALLEQYRAAPVQNLPRFSGGLVGYLGYDTAPYFEPSLPFASDRDPQRQLPDGIFLLADTLVAFDHAYGRLLLIANVTLEAGQDDGRAEGAARRDAEARLDALQHRLSLPLPSPVVPGFEPERMDLQAHTSRERFAAAVLRAKEHIAAGDIFQVVLSQKFTRQTSAAPFNIYRALRRLNPSPYMFYFDFGELAGDQPLHLIGASPEMHVRLEEDRAVLRPIAGTRPRGQSPKEDASLGQELISDPKERAEHVMLVDLARNDLGRVSDYGTVRVSELMEVERYSHVMHIVSQVEGRLRPEFDAFDLMRATFPAGTVSGAPKIRAMQIISELEGRSRGPYAGAVGYFSYHGSMDTCIAIRTLVMQGQEVSMQAGAGVVADSLPEREYEETLNKARALAVAVEMAEAEQGRPERIS